MQGDKQQAENLALALNVDPALAIVLTERGVTTFNEARAYFRPQLTDFHDPFLMKDMDKAIARIEKALRDGEKILIYGDYDVDGTTAVTVVLSYYRQHTSNIDFYIPDRHKEGYGISTDGIDFAAKEGFSLIIALDCGIKSNDKVDYANTLGVDFIICDHHLPSEDIPSAVAVLDPKRADCSYPFKELSGCGIGLKLIQAFSIKNNLSEDTCLEYLDLAMVSIAADIVSMTDENRLIAWHGLVKLNERPCAGLKALMNISGKPLPFSISDVVFQLAPRINAAGRMGHANQAVNMLLCHEGESAIEQSFQINNQNTDRRSSDQATTDEALKMIGASALLQQKKTTVVYGKSWNKGVIGIVASRLTETYYRPTIVLTESNGKITGSARSVAGFDLYDALCQCGHFLEQFGGHPFAAGLTMHPDNLEAFTNCFEEVVADSISEELLIPTLLIDAEIALKQIDAKFYRILQQMAPFGPDNMMPIFSSGRVKLVGNATLVGKDHLKFCIMQENSAKFNCIAFGQADMLEQLKPDMEFSVCYTIEENHWKDRRTIQLNIKSIVCAADTENISTVGTRQMHPTNTNAELH